MILNIRGTHGSGKTTVVSRILSTYRDGGDVVSVSLPDRARPVGYQCSNPTMRPLYIPGHYETPTGGCDTISSIESIFGSVIAATQSDRSVLFEGIVAQHSAGRLLELHATHPVTVIVLSTPLDECIASVKSRREARGQIDEFNPRNVIKEFNSVVSSTKRLRRDGMRGILELSREDAFQHCLEALRCAP